MTKILRETKKNRIEEKINTIQNLYDLVFEKVESNLINVKEFKIDLLLRESDVSLMKAIKIIKKQIAVLKDLNDLYPKHSEIQELMERLFEVHNFIIILLKEEFNNYRKKYDYLEY